MKLSEINYSSMDYIQCPINQLYSLEDVHTKYYLTYLDLIYDTLRNVYIPIHILSNGYPAVTLCRNEPGLHGREITLHKVIALARIHNGPYELIEHLDDNCLNLQYSNLKFSSKRDNALSAFRNGRRDCPSNTYRVTMLNGEIYEGTMAELERMTGVPRETIYDKYSKRNNTNLRSKEILLKRRQSKVYTVELIQEAPKQKYLSKRFIDYRKGNFQGRILFEKFILDYE